MKIGTKTLLFGCHQFIIHPIYIYIAWRKLYGEFPSLGETVAIIIHDWGYLGKSDLDGKEGDRHPEWAHNFFFSISRYVPNLLYIECLYLSQLCLYHSRFYAKKDYSEPSKLCWADKYSTILYGKYLWSLLATLSGEGKEYMTSSRYEIYHKGSKGGGTVIWSENYAKLMVPVIYENAAKYRK